MAAEELVITNIRTPGTIWFLKALSQYLISQLLPKTILTEDPLDS